MSNSDQISRWILQRELAHAPGLVGGLAKEGRSLIRQSQPGEFVVQCVRVADSPVATRVIPGGQKIRVPLEVDYKISPTQNVVIIASVAGSETERLIKGSRAAQIMYG